MPPRFGVSSAAAGIARASPPKRPAANRSANGIVVPRFAIILRSLAGCRRRFLFVEPHRPQILVEVMARADLPALDISMVRNRPVPPQQEDLVRLGIEDMLLERAHQGALPGGVGLTQYLVVEID